uniref:LRRCT domain-containing protein n=1 Tax=Hucho hucho TaxID=62062 RepID=A0A4W5R2L2_9TELE
MGRKTTWKYYCGDVLGGILRILKSQCFGSSAAAVFVCLLLLFSSVKAEDECPLSCICARDSGTVTCRDNEDTELPGDIPAWATTLILRGNNISTLPGGGFSSNNGTKLELTTLSLQVRVYLSLNPFRCNCELESFYFWLKNSSQCVDAARLLCAEPVAKKGIPIERLRGEDVDCLNENLEAVSYVFLGIVLALIGIVFLMLKHVLPLYCTTTTQLRQRICLFAVAWLLHSDRYVFDAQITCEI